jgi:hypothetical protein
MNRFKLPVLLASLLCVAACRPSAPQPGVDMDALRAAMQEHTETLLLIHFKLDNARKEISGAEQRSATGECATAGYHAADAYRELQAADDLLLDLGQDLQQLFHLDAAGRSD